MKSQFAPPATVTESKLLLDRLTGTPREVDICIESVVAGHSVIVSLECRDHARPADVKWVDEMRGKHDRLPTNALVLVSRSGFTPEAQTAAHRCGIETLSFEEVATGTLDHVLAPTSRIWGKIFELTPSKVIAVVSPIEGHAGERVRLLPENDIFAPEARSLGSAREVVQSLLHTTRVVELLGRDGTESHQSYDLHWELPRTATGDRLFLQKVAPRVFVPIERIEISGPCRFSVCEFHMRSGSLGQVRVSWGTGQLEGRSAMLVAVEQDDAKSKVTLQLRGKP